jgi:hypothetical protein
MVGIEPSSTPLPRKVFNHHLDALLETGQLNPDILPYMDAEQQWIVNEVKKSLIRINKRYAREATQNSIGA